MLPRVSVARGLTSELVTVRKCLLISVRSNVNSSGAREDDGGTSSVWSPASAADLVRVDWLEFPVMIANSYQRNVLCRDQDPWQIVEESVSAESIECLRTSAPDDATCCPGKLGPSFTV